MASVINVNDNEFKFVIYKITNLVTGRYYIGKHKTRKPQDWYYGSSPDLQKDIKALGKDKFKKEILHVYKKESTMKKREKLIVNHAMVMNPKTYNIRVGG